MTYLRIAMTRHSAANKPRLGDEQVVDGVTYVRQFKRAKYGPAKGSIVLSASGRPMYEWVEKPQ